MVAFEVQNQVFHISFLSYRHTGFQTDLIVKIDIKFYRIHHFRKFYMVIFHKTDFGGKRPNKMIGGILISQSSMNQSRLRYINEVSTQMMMNSLEEKDYHTCFLQSLYLTSKIPFSKSVYYCLSESLDKLTLTGPAKRAAIIGLHVHPSDTQLLDQVIKHTDLDHVKLRKLSQKPGDFDLNLYFFKKYPIEMFSHVLKHVSQSLHFRIIFEECVKNGYDNMSLQILKAAVKQHPNEFYHLLADMYSKTNQPFLAYKSLMMNAYYTHTNEYLQCGDLLERSNHLPQSILCLHQYYIETKNPQILDRILGQIETHNKNCKHALREKVLKSAM
jgi:hypothetical protein